MSALSDQIEKTKELLSALDAKQKRRVVEHRTKQKFSRMGKKRKRGRVRALPLILTRSAAITLLLVSIAIVIGGIEYFSDQEANAISDKNPVIISESVEPVGSDDALLLDLLSEQ
jgi:hypothetical protein